MLGKDPGLPGSASTRILGIGLLPSQRERASTTRITSTSAHAGIMRRRTAECFMRFIHLSRQFDVGSGVANRKAARRVGFTSPVSTYCETSRLIPGLEADLLAAFQKRLHLIQAHS